MSSSSKSEGVQGEALLAPVARGVVQEVLKAERQDVAAHGPMVPVLVIPNDRKAFGLSDIIERHERTQEAPYRRRGTYHAASVASLIAWMSANTDEQSPVFGEGIEKPNDWKKPKLALVGIGNYSEKSDAEWHDFRGRYDFPVAEPWNIWAAKHGEVMNQMAFAEFIEDRIYDLASPVSRETLPESVTRFLENAKGASTATPSQIYELSRGLKITANCKLEQKIDTGSGETMLRYTEEHVGQGGRPIKVPDIFYIRIPVFFGIEPTLIGVRLRYRAVTGNVSWSFQLFAPEMVIAEQFEAACETVRKAKRTVYLGSPDAPG